MDDDLVTTTDKQKHHSIEEGILGIKKIFTSRYANDGKQSYAYRPITTYSFAIEYDLFKDSENRAQKSHFINIVLYAIAGMILFKYLLLLFDNKKWWFAALATFIFMIHPIHSEAVNSIKSRDELLAFIFGFAFLIQAIKYVDHKKWINLIGAFFFMYLAVFSKETGTVFVALLPVSIYFFRNKNIKQLIIAIVVLGLSYFAIKKGMNIILNKESIRYFLYFENPLYTLDFSYRIPMFFYSILLYVGLLIIPYPLKYYYGYAEIPLIGYGDWQFYAGLVVVGAILYFILKGLKEKKFYSFILLFFMLAIGGAGNLLFPLPGIIGERFAFIASVGFALFVAWIVYRLTKSNLEEKIHAARSKSVLGVLGLVTLVAMVYSFQRNKDWESTYSLYSADMPKLERSMKAHSLLATEYTTKASAIQRTGNLDLFNEMVENTELALLHN
jgi:hypothetical protein